MVIHLLLHPPAMSLTSDSNSNPPRKEPLSPHGREENRRFREAVPVVGAAEPGRDGGTDTAGLRASVCPGKVTGRGAQRAGQRGHNERHQAHLLVPQLHPRSGRQEEWKDSGPLSDISQLWVHVPAPAVSLGFLI